MESTDFMNLFTDAGFSPEPIESSSESDDDGSSGEDEDDDDDSEGNWCFSYAANNFFVLLWLFVIFLCSFISK